MGQRIAIHQPSARFGLGTNVFGKDVANLDLFRGLARHGGFERVDFLLGRPTGPEAVCAAFGLGPEHPTEIAVADVMDPRAPAEAGLVLRGGPRMEEAAWRRRRTAGDGGYSLAGLIHTLAPPTMRHEIAQALVAPMHPWDALICTSPAVQAALGRLLDDYADYLRDRFGGDRAPRPMLPLIPLAVEAEAFGGDDGSRRARLRARLGVTADEVLVIWVGRLSYFEKAFPQPMMRAVAEAAETAGRRVHFAMAGWFPNPESGERMYREAAAAYAPGLPFHLLDGNDRDLLGDLWAGADVFLSLVDNIQETFGITPLEAMASGLPVVASDWDGYRYTVRDGVEGFLIPTLLGPAGAFPDALVDSHLMQVRSYQQYVGIVAQHTAVNVAAAAEALARLIASPELRRRMGAAGRERVRTAFDWRVVAPQYRALAQELGRVRAGAGAGAGARGAHPTKGDPLRDFAGFATDVLGVDTVVSLHGDAKTDLARTAAVELDRFAGNWRADADAEAQLLAALAEGPRTVRDLLAPFAPGRRRPLLLSLLWMAKVGLLTWRRGSPK